ncbi:MAG: hypothetical protein A2359_03240 [Candidatus Moranbacteria bacterium RIFOXYB1_FULL_43_19]|nr:MAG: hypothetical protein A2359_03240 [Candidatus Moranbacteria bacterium RIFOXYB1_FULL_43_19]OGI28397.1 MAG: hypothetical protein A2184_01765 [Candidatus Moranbacteria bacterium RIFOXYA1_FULL_44_7]OGI32573.1 MAG: hypothetical protein A2420_03295 [Candidatus Moranbacteria bacterium RIFOXYC1_FULL_44_13]OGI38126.1 MAG: hypothetical protein A2612_02190 [Candidatus Moranbacteria bacterium RIFOXYD1_FULL_44_12]
MKKLTPFQKKVARWVGGRRWPGNLVFVVVLVAIFFMMRFEIEKKEIWQAVVSVACFLIAAYATIILDVAEFRRQFIPEIQAEKAEVIAKENPKYAERINELIQEALAQDDGGELQVALEKLKIMVGKGKCLADLPNQAEKLKTEIAALEKELGLQGRRNDHESKKSKRSS